MLDPHAAHSHLSRREARERAARDLDGLIGMEEVKAEVRRLMNFLDIQRERRRQGLKTATQSLHFVFAGNPGTGKTTVARILGNVFYGFGVLLTPKVVECDRAALVGGFLGQTAIKTNEKIDEALDGVLFIDEAYALARDPGKYAFGDQFGDEAIDILLKRMEDDRDRLIVIVAGYPRKMEEFINTNPGLESRFTRHIRFEDYSPQELCRIFDQYARDNQYRLTPDACLRTFGLFSVKYEQRTERFGNARDVRNTYEQVIGWHSDRVAALRTLNKGQLITIDVSDIPYVAGAFEPTASLFAGSKWEGECPRCAKAVLAGIESLGQPVDCACGCRFGFPWWNLVPDSVSALPSGFYVRSRRCDLIGTSVPRGRPIARPVASSASGSLPVPLPAPRPAAPVPVPQMKPTIKPATKDPNACPACGRVVPGPPGVRYCMCCNCTF